MNFACLYIPNFVVQAAARAAPELHRRPIAIAEGTIVVAASELALKAGVVPGMTTLEAADVAGIEMRIRAPQQEQVAHAALLDLSFSFSVRVEDAARDAILLDLAGLGRLLGPPEEMARKMVERSRELGFEACVAIAPNLETAFDAARGFPGITLIPYGQEQDRLCGLPLALLDPPGDVLDTLDRWGVRTFGDLASLPTAQLSERLGQEGVRLQARACGVSRRALVPTQPATQFEEFMEWDDPIEQLDSLTFAWGMLLNRICARLKSRGLGTHELRVEMDLDPRPEAEQIEARAAARYEKKFRLPVPTQNATTLLKLLQLHLDAHPPSGPVTKVVIHAESARLRALQRGLFLPASPDPEKLEVTLARLAKLAGEENVGSPEAVDTHRPDVFRMVRFNPFESRRKITAAHEPGALARKERLTALRIFRPPLVARVEIRNGLPHRVFFGDVQGEVASASGPWRASGEWWSDGWAFDEWDLEIRVHNSTQAHASLHRLCCREGKWFVTAVYD